MLNIKLPTQVEMEYCVNEQFKNNGNITVLGKEVLKGIFEEKVFDGLKIKESQPVSNINSIRVSINKDNYASLAVARKLGFNEDGYLNINDYYRKF